jgi:hypothetical protein
MGTGGGAACDLDIDRRIAFAQLILFEQPLGDRRNSVDHMVANAQFAQPVPHPLHVRLHHKDSAIVDTRYLVHAIREQKPTVINGHARRGVLHVFAIQINEHCSF